MDIRRPAPDDYWDDGNRQGCRPIQLTLRATIMATAGSSIIILVELPCWQYLATMPGVIGSANVPPGRARPLTQHINGGYIKHNMQLRAGLPTTVEASETDVAGRANGETKALSILTTERLRFEPMCAAHLNGLHEMNRDPAVMQFIGKGLPESLADTQATIARVEARWREWGFGWWSIFEKASNELIGAGAVQYLNKTPGQPLELGWRLRRDRWGKGYATEVAHALVNISFTQLAAPLVCAICKPENVASRHVMTKLGMRYIDERAADGVLVAYYELLKGDYQPEQRS